MQTRYIPTGSIEVKDRHSDAVAYIYSSQQNGKPAARVFFGKQSQPVLAAYFSNEQQRERRITELFAARGAAAKAKAEYKAERTKPHTLKVGDILDSSWGYDQTNVDYYQVTRIVGPHSVEIRKIGTSAVEGSTYKHGMADTCVPVPNSFVGEPMIKRANSTNSVKIESYAHASPWDGKPNYRSWYA